MNSTLTCAVVIACNTWIAGGSTLIAGFPAAKSAHPKEEFSNRSYRQGVVTAMDKGSITIECPKTTWRAAKPGPGGSTLWVDETLPALPPKRFMLSPALMKGDVPSEPRDQYRVSELFMYRSSDVKVGDWLCIVYSQVDGVEFCDHMKIVKRPGGRVPPLPASVKEPSFIPYHERQNAYWDLEDKGIPYPAHFKHLRRWPLAPMPRAIPERRLIDQ